MALNTIQLLNILKKDKDTLKTFIGVFPKDRLPLRLNYPCCFILNTQRSYQQGEHWLAVYADEHQNVDFFDSYGHSPNYFNLENYLKKISRNYFHNTIQLQSYSSQICGYYCVLFLLYRSKGFSLKDFQEKFSKNSNLNDFIILNLIKT